MFCSVLSAAIHGVDAVPVQVEADVGEGMPQFVMVGSASIQVKEGQDRVKTALRNTGIILPPKRITVNLVPADIRKEGTRFDLAVAAAVLKAAGRIPAESLLDIMVAGEVRLNGKIQGVSGILPTVLLAREIGCRTCIIPSDNIIEGKVVEGIRVIGIHSLEELICYCCDPWEDTRDEGQKPSAGMPSYTVDFSDIKGQKHVKRAALIAACGFHNLLLSGTPGSGKSMIAQRIPTIMPQLSQEESLELSKIYSVAGLLPAGMPLLKSRPFRSPHHTISPQALAGGGRMPVPGEITLAHRGVLFLDELAEVQRHTIELLRQPLEERQIVIARVSGTCIFPASFMLVGAM
ncbi:MAG: ATP-binding protein, partial [Lachnospiraceae bacterium]|nr:ATP-binding protein [Lachnospiraceae bacterium]